MLFKSQDTKLKNNISCVGLKPNHCDHCELIDNDIDQFGMNYYFGKFFNFKFFTQFVFLSNIYKTIEGGKNHLLGVVNEQSIPKRLRLEITIFKFYRNLKDLKKTRYFSSTWIWGLCKTMVCKEMNSF